MDTQKIRTIFITTLTAVPAFMLFSPFAAAYFYESDDIFFSPMSPMLKFGCPAVIPIAILVFVAMWGWTVSIGWKLSIVIFHIFFACVAALVWLFCFVDWHMIP